MSKKPIVENNKARLILANKEVDFDIMPVTCGPQVINVSSLYKETGMFTYDPGFLSTASCSSQITYIDGNKGELLYRGYPVDMLSNKYDFLDVVYLLLNGELPSLQEKDIFVSEVRDNVSINENIYNIINSYPKNSHPMSILLGVVSAMSSFYQEEGNIDDLEYQHKVILHAISKIPTIAAMIYRYLSGRKFIKPRLDLDYINNFCYMMFAADDGEYSYNKTFVEAIDKIFIHHADHEQNASTAAVRLVCSTGANPFACLSAGIASLWGPYHGGANEAVIKMLHKIGSINNIPEFIAKVKSKQELLMGFGHRVYKNYDPRAKFLQQICHTVLSQSDIDGNSFLEIAVGLERIALADKYFIDRKLYPNVDFYSGIIYQAMNIPSEMFTPLFAVSRVTGWIAQWQEMINNKSEFRIGRPRQRYTGSNRRDIPSNL